MRSRAVVLSPHLDDAVLSCWEILNRESTLVINVCSGVPQGQYEDQLTPTDQFTLSEAGVTDIDNSADYVRRRRDEDRAATRRTSVKTEHLPFLDCQYYPDSEPAPLEDIHRELKNLMVKSEIIYAPAAIASFWGFVHPDHQRVRDAALRLLEEGHSLRLYGDLPYALRAQPKWWMGLENENPDSDFLLSDLREANLDNSKHQALREYVTQVPALNRVWEEGVNGKTGIGRIDENDRYVFEANWAAHIQR